MCTLHLFSKDVQLTASLMARSPSLHAGVNGYAAGQPHPHARSCTASAGTRDRFELHPNFLGRECRTKPGFTILQFPRDCVKHLRPLGASMKVNTLVGHPCVGEIFGSLHIFTGFPVSGTTEIVRFRVCGQVSHSSLQSCIDCSGSCLGAATP